MAAGIGHAVGIGMSARQRGSDDIGVAFFGDGAANHGNFHEALNFAAVQRAPVVFVCENNLYATATPLKTITLNPEIATKAQSYGMPGVAVDGNDVFAVWLAMKEATERARSGKGPTLIEAKTYRTVGHHEGDPVIGTYRTQEELDAWIKRDPIDMFRKRLIEDYGIADEETLAKIEAHIDKVVQDALEFARNSPEPDPATVRLHVFADPINPPEALRPRAVGETRTQGWLEAVRDGIAEEMRANANILYFGEGTGERGGSFAHTKNLWQEFGAERMVDTPISEQGFTSAAVGASATGARTVSDLMFADFAFETAGPDFPSGRQAPLHEQWSDECTDGGARGRRCSAQLGAASQRHLPPRVRPYARPDRLCAVEPRRRQGIDEDCFAGVGPGHHAGAEGAVRVQGRGAGRRTLMCRSVSPASHVPEPTSQSSPPARWCSARSKRQRPWRRKASRPRSSIPERSCRLTWRRLCKSVTKTHRLLVVDEAWAMCGLGGEIAQSINELAFDELDAPPGRLHTAQTSHPFAPVLERAMLVDTARIEQGALDVIAGVPPVPDHWYTVGIKSAGPTAPVRAPVKPAASVAPAPATPSDDEPVTMPFGDLTVSEGTIVKWLKSVGDRVKAGELIAEIETDKAVVEIEAPVSGTLGRIDQPVGAVVPMGGRIGGIKK